MSLHACMAYLCLIQGHPYSNDADESPAAPRWFYWLVIGLIGVGIGVWVRKNLPPGGGDGQK